MATKTQRGYLDEVYNLALSVGIPEVQARLAASQSALETGYGAHAPKNAYFGVKAGSSWNGPTQTLSTKEEVNGKLVSIKDQFRVYDNKEASLLDWWDRVQNRWPAAATADNFDDAVKGLRTGKSGGYATDSTYVGKIKNVHSGLAPRPPGYIPDVGTELSTSALPSLASLVGRGVVPPPLPKRRPEPPRTAVAAIDALSPQKTTSAVGYADAPSVNVPLPRPRPVLGLSTLAPPNLPLNPPIPSSGSVGHGTLQINPHSFTKSLPVSNSDPVGFGPETFAQLRGFAVDNGKPVTAPTPQRIGTYDGSTDLNRSVRDNIGTALRGIPGVAPISDAISGVSAMLNQKPVSPIAPIAPKPLASPLLTAAQRSAMAAVPAPVSPALTPAQRNALAAVPSPLSKVAGGVTTIAPRVTAPTPIPYPIVRSTAPTIRARAPATIPLSHVGRVNPVSQIIPQAQGLFGQTNLGRIINWATQGNVPQANVQQRTQQQYATPTVGDSTNTIAGVDIAFMPTSVQQSDRWREAAGLPTNTSSQSGKKK